MKKQEGSSVEKVKTFQEDKVHEGETEKDVQSDEQEISDEQSSENFITEHREILDRLSSAELQTTVVFDEEIRRLPQTVTIEQFMARLQVALESLEKSIIRKEK